MSARSLFSKQSLRLTRPFQASITTARPLFLKESARDTEVDHDAHKQESLRNQKQGNAAWKKELASDSEEAINADRSTLTNGNKDDHIKELQHETKKAAEQGKK